MGKTRLVKIMETNSFSLRRLVCNTNSHVAMIPLNLIKIIGHRGIGTAGHIDWLYIVVNLSFLT